MRRLKDMLQKLKNSKKPFKFLISRLLMDFRLAGFFRILIDKKDFKIRFYPTSLSASLWLDPSYFDQDESLLRRFLSRGDIFIDVGANVGTFALCAASIVGKEGRVYAFEPHPRIFRYLRKNIELNRFKNITAIQTAVGNQRGEVAFLNKRSDDQNRVEQSSRCGRVPVSTLDELVENFERIDFLKIDVEGYEKMVIEGAVQILKKVRCIYFESFETFFNRFGYSTNDLLDLIRSYGFEIYKINKDNIQRVGRDYSSIVHENLFAVREKSYLVDKILESEPKF